MQQCRAMADPLKCQLNSELIVDFLSTWNALTVVKHERVRTIKETDKVEHVSVNRHRLKPCLINIWLGSNLLFILASYKGLPLLLLPPIVRNVFIEHGQKVFSLLDKRYLTYVSDEADHYIREDDYRNAKKRYRIIKLLSWVLFSDKISVPVFGVVCVLFEGSPKSTRLWNVVQISHFFTCKYVQTLCFSKARFITTSQINILRCNTVCVQPGTVSTCPLSYVSSQTTNLHTCSY